MSIDSYKNEIDRFCDENYNVSSEEMLIMAKKSLSGADIRRRKIHTRRFAGLAAAFVAVSAVAVTAAAGAAGHGPMSFIFSHYIDDQTTAELVDSGYYFTVTDPVDAASQGAAVKGYAGFGETINTDLISTTLIGIAGDTQQPKILLDARINDKAFNDKYDHFFIVTKTIGAEIYEQGLDGDYGPNYGFAVKDDNDPTLYHISVDAPVAWVTGGEESVFTIESLQAYSGTMLRKYRVTEQEVEDSWNHAKQLPADKAEVFMTFEEYDIDDISYRFVVPDNVLKPVTEKTYKNMVFENDGVSYCFDNAEFGSYSTWFSVYIDGIDPSRSPEDSGTEDANAMSLGKSLILDVDGTELRAHLDDNATALPWCDQDGVCGRGEANAWYVAYHFDAVDFDKADRITLSDGRKSYVLKGKAAEKVSAPVQSESAVSGYAGIGETINTPAFSTTLAGISGTDDPKIHVDLKVNDSNIASKYDVFFITGRTLGAEVYDSDKRDNYGIDYGFGVRDAADPNLYHLTINGASAWMSDDQVTVFEIQSVTAYSSSIMSRYSLTEQDLIDSWQYAKPLSNEKMGGINSFEKYDLDLQYRFIAY